MIIPTVLRSGIATANKITKGFGLQAQVTFQRTTSLDGYGAASSSSVPLLAIVDVKTVQVHTPGGIVQATRSQLTFLDIAALVSATGGLGFIKDTDRIVLPDGSTNAIMETGGFVDAGTGHPIATEVTLG